ncbi:MAG: flippase-like domain-containing protein [Fibrobacteria bacterium]|nr:flippase-like domain-containing protein [Fibrobacteria bacterium]
MKIIKHLIKPLLGILIIYFLIAKGGLSPALIKQALLTHPFYIATALCFYLFLTVLAGFRWYILVRCGHNKIGFSNIFSLHMIGLFFVTILPGGTGGDFVKGYYIYRDTTSKKAFALTSILMDRIVGAYGLLLWGITGVFLNWKMAFYHPILKWNCFFYLTMFFILTSLIILFFSPFALMVLNHPLIGKLPGKKALKGLFDAIQVYRNYPRILLASLLLTLVIHGSIILIFYFTALGLDIELNIIKHGFVVPVLMMINGLPISPGGIGVGEAAAHTLYSLINVSKGGEILVFFHVFVIIVAIIGAPFYFLYRKKT